jgi:hypothetical protein
VKQPSARIGFLPLISGIIPARNEEASIARVVDSVAAQAEVGEVIVVDDQSTDETPRVLRELAARIPKLKIIEAGELPPGWVGKNHAVAIGAAAATGEWLLFTDADTFHYPGSARRALADAAEHAADLVSYSPEQEFGAWWDHSLVTFVFCRLGAKFPYERVNDPARPDAAANGQYVFVSRACYDAVGGHAALAGEVLEDVAFARRVKGSGHRIYLTAPAGVVRTRMYRSFGAMWEGWTKNLYALVGGTSSSVLRELAVVLPWPAIFCLFLYPLTARQGAQEGAKALDLGLAAAFLLLWHGLYGIALSRSLLPASNIKYYIPGSALYSAAVLASWWKSARGKASWKGRTYPIGKGRVAQGRAGNGADGEAARGSAQAIGGLRREAR